MIQTHDWFGFQKELRTERYIFLLLFLFLFFYFVFVFCCCCFALFCFSFVKILWWGWLKLNWICKNIIILYIINSLHKNGLVFFPKSIKEMQFVGRLVSMKYYKVVTSELLWGGTWNDDSNKRNWERKNTLFL